MNGLRRIESLPEAPTAGVALPRVVIDWPRLLEQRSAVLAHSDMPDYLLLPEVHALREAAHNDNLQLLIDTLWHTGARISECLALTPAHFNFELRDPYVSLQSLKKRGRPRRQQRGAKPRLVPIINEAYIRRVRRYARSHGLRRHDRLFPVTRSAINKRFDRLLGQMPVEQRPVIRVTPHVLRHSFAVNAVLHGTPLNVLQQWLGHQHIETTLIYTRVLTLETHHLMRRIQF